jgi:pimeloyl-ACP methyl ester carboxylesterase
MPPSGLFPLNNPRDAQRSLETVLARCMADGACNAAYPELPSRFEEALAGFDSHPASVQLLDPVSGDSIGYPVGRAAFAWAIRRVLMNSDLHSHLPSIVHQAAAGDVSGLEPGLEGTLGVTDGMYMGMGLSVMCTEETERLGEANIGAETGGTFIGDGPIRTMMEACAEWPLGKVPSGYHEPVRSDIPVLLLSGETDPTTPARWGAMAARTLPNGLHLVLPGVSHAPFPACAIRIMAAFVEAGSIEGLDTSCVAEIPLPEFDLP